MKKINTILALASAFLLSACSASIGMSKEDAKKKLEEYSAHAQEKTFTMPRKLSYSSQAVMEANGESSTFLSTVDIDLDAKCIFSYTSMPVGTVDEEGSVTGLTEWTPCYWLWTAKEGEEQKYYFAYSSSKTDYSEAYFYDVDKETFNEKFEEMNEYLSAEGFEKAYAKLVKDLDNILLPGEKAVESSEEETLSEETPVAEEEYSYNIEESSLEESYLSSGDGNLEVNATMKASGTYAPANSAEGEKNAPIAFTAENTVKLKVENYLPLSEETILKSSQKTGEKTKVLSAHTTTTYSWGSCNFTAPDLSKFPAEPSEAGE
ncbi:MAG: hypothetical protein SPL80_07155 [Bacilli bacterium]|nr:hypothetical protein [Bacilli bacterium]